MLSFFAALWLLCFILVLAVNARTRLRSRRRAGAQKKPAGLTPGEEGYADAHRDPSSLQPGGGELLRQLLDNLTENPGLLRQPGVEQLLSACIQAAEKELEDFSFDAGASLRRLRSKRRAELLALAKRGGRISRNRGRL